MCGAAVGRQERGREEEKNAQTSHASIGQREEKRVRVENFYGAFVHV
jgi:hypothetical protein